MSVKIRLNEKIILDVPTISFNFVYQNIHKTIEENGNPISENIENLIEHLYQACFRIGLDLARFIKDNEFLNFIQK